MSRKSKEQRKERRQKRNAARASAPSRHQGLEASRWDRSPAAKRSQLEEHDNFAPLRNRVRALAGLQEEWAGIPLPLDGERLVVSPRYPFAEALSKIMIGEEAKEEEDHGLKVRGIFWSCHMRSDIHVLEDENGRVSYGLSPGIHHIAMDLRTLGCSEAWGIEQESNALDLLARMIGHRKFKQYLLTGIFLETSQRSRLTYVFRRLKPTVALAARAGEKVRILATLCMHPIAHYAGSWAGAMCPTDDVIAHLSMMRGDERLFWARSNQAAPHRPEAGL